MERIIGVGAMRLTDAQLEQFREQGCLNAGRMFSDAELQEVGGEYDRLVTPDQTLGDGTGEGFPYQVMLHMRSDALKRYVTHPAMLELTMQLLGPDVRLWWDQGINKPPGTGRQVPWHQDNGFTKGLVPEYLTTWLALDDSSLANGGLYVIPGSHAGGLRKHVSGDDGFYRSVPDVDESAAIELPARAGDLLLFSSFILHRTVGNTTPDRQRRAWVIQYHRADVVNSVTGETYEHLPQVTRAGQPIAL